jgi:maltose O-acetyltransferase
MGTSMGESVVRGRRLVRLARSRLRGVPDIVGFREAGAVIGARFQPASGFFLTRNDCPFVTIGDDVVCGPQVMLIAHDASLRNQIDYTRTRPIAIGSSAFIGARAVILPGVTVGEGSIVAAGSVVDRDVEPYTIVAGNRAVVVGKVDDLVAKWRGLASAGPTFGPGWKDKLLSGSGQQFLRRSVGDGSGWFY